MQSHHTARRRIVGAGALFALAAGAVPAFAQAAAKLDDPDDHRHLRRRQHLGHSDWRARGEERQHEDGEGLRVDARS